MVSMRALADVRGRGDVPFAVHPMHVILSFHMLPPAQRKLQC